MCALKVLGSEGSQLGHEAAMEDAKRCGQRKRVEGRMYLLQAFLNRHDRKSVTGKCVARNEMCAECWLCR